MAIEALTADYPVVVEQAVAWGEMDAFRHVNNTVYFRWFENARIAYMARLGWPELELQTGVGITLASVQARFRRPIVWPDAVLITARAVRIESDRFTLQHVIVSRKLEAIATEGEGLVVTFNHEAGKKSRMPEEMRKRIEALEAGQLP
jgi:acyl-CoA thioester hydrolase